MIRSQKSHQSYLFGGYTSRSWGISPSRLVPYSDPEAFLFQLNAHSIMRPYQKKHACMNHSLNCLVSFGDGGETSEDSDLCIYDECDKRAESYSNLGQTYELPDALQYGSIEA